MLLDGSTQVLSKHWYDNVIQLKHYCLQSTPWPDPTKDHRAIQTAFKKGAYPENFRILASKLLIW
jgi:hypothetical protein